MLEVTLNFEEFESGLPDQQVQIFMTKQQLDDATTEAIQGLASASALVAGGAAASSSIVNTLISGSLSQLWGMINSMQILVHLGIFNVDFPINAQIVNENIVTVATFEIPKLNVDDMFGTVVSLPEDDAPIEKTKETA